MAQNKEETKVDFQPGSPSKLVPTTGLEVFVKSLPFTTTQDEVLQFFNDCGTVENVNLLKDRFGRLKGIGFIRFSTKEAATKAVAKNGKEFGGRTLVIELAQPKEDRPQGIQRNPRQGNGNGENRNGSSVFVGNLSYATTETSIKDFFSDCGAIKAVRLATDRDGSSKGFAHIDFENEKDAEGAVQKSGKILDERNIRVDYANAGRNREGGFRGGSRGGFRGGRGGFSGGRGRGGFSGGRGRGGFSGGRGRGGFSGNREGGFSGNREGGYSGNREGGYSGSREGGYSGNREGGYSGSREGGFREGGQRRPQ